MRCSSGRRQRFDGDRPARAHRQRLQHCECPGFDPGLTLPALSFALTLDRMVNGASRPFFGWLSDHIGREHTMFLAFLLEGAGIYALFVFASNPIAFVVLSGLVFFAWGEIYSLFPAMCTDIYGRKFATTNYGMLYTAKGTASLLVPLSSVLTAATGDWHTVFILAALLDIGAALMALLLLKPLRIKEIARGQEDRKSVV